jgi:hypothetical protein
MDIVTIAFLFIHIYPNFINCKDSSYALLMLDHLFILGF